VGEGSVVSQGDLIVNVQGLHKTYFGLHPLEVLRGIDLQVGEGEFVAVLGQSGSGKSTLLNILGALDRPSEGTVIIQGLDLAKQDDLQLANLRNCCIGFIFQFHYLLSEFTCLENSLMPVAIRKGEPEQEDIDRVTAMLERIGLGERLQNRPAQLSGGEQQRTAIVRALCNHPRLVLADEPTGNLDSKTGSEVFSLMREMNRETGAAFIMVTHDDRLAAQADRTVEIVDGNLVG